MQMFIKALPAAAMLALGFLTMPGCATTANHDHACAKAACCGNCASKDNACCGSCGGTSEAKSCSSGCTKDCCAKKCASGCTKACCANAS
ncbi:MAG: hypothetical protein AAGB34_01125 [Planctomycetota bacterium]